LKHLFPSSPLQLPRLITAYCDLDQIANHIVIVFLPTFILRIKKSTLNLEKFLINVLLGMLIDYQ